MLLQHFRFLLIAFLFVLLVSLMACSGGIRGLEPTLTATTTPTETPTPTATPTLTPTPLPPVGVLLVPEGADPQLAEQMQSFVSEKITQEGMRFQVRPSLSRDDFERDDFRWIIALPPYDGLGTLAAARPESRFLVVGFNDLEPSANLTVITLPEDWFLQQAFIAGYIGMVITPDWRAGMLRVNTPEGELAAQAFTTGALFFCASPSAPGQVMFCRPDYAPIIQYPIVVYGEPEVSTPEEWQGVGRYLLTQFVETIFISPDIQSDQLVRYLAHEGGNMIGGVKPPGDVSESWVATLEFDLFQAFQTHWPEFASGTDGVLVDVPLAITDVNPELLSPGRQHFVEKMLSDLTAGFVDYGLEQSVNNP